jgi:hypothetical protein
MDENKTTNPFADDDYVDVRKKNTSLEGVSVGAILDDGDYVDVRKKNDSLGDISASTAIFAEEPEYQSGSKTETNSLADIETSNIVLTDDIPVAETKKADLSDIQGAKLDEDEPAPEYQQAYVTEDLDAIKREAAEKARQDAFDRPANFDQKKSREAYLALMEEQKREAAKKGFVISLILAGAGIVMSVLMFLYVGLTPVKEDAPGADTIGTVITYAGVAGILCSVALLLGIKALKGVANFLFGVLVLANLGAGGWLLVNKEEGHFVTNFVLLALIVIANIVVCFTLGSNEKVDLYYSRKDVN